MKRVAKLADLCGKLSGRDRSPGRNGPRTSSAIVDGGKSVAGKVKEIGDLIVNGQEHLDLSRRFEPLHYPLSAPRRQMKVFRPVVDSLVLSNSPA